MAMDTITLPDTIPDVEGAQLADVAATAYFRAESYEALHLLVFEHRNDARFRRAYSSETGELNHVAWVERGLTVCVWAPAKGGA